MKVYDGLIVQEKKMNPMWTHPPHLFMVKGDLAIPISRMTAESQRCFGRTGICFEESYFQEIDQLRAHLLFANAEVQP